jgi:hypothetical protein
MSKFQSNARRFGQERIDYVCRRRSHLRMLDWFPALIKDIYFCADHPDNHTVRVTNVRLPYVSVHDGSKWTPLPTSLVAYHIINKCIDAIDAIVDPAYPPADYREFCELYDADDKRLMRRLQRCVRDVLRAQHMYTQPMRRLESGASKTQSHVALATVQLRTTSSS